MDMREFSRINRERCEAPQGFNHSVNSWSLSDWFTAFVGELGEAANVAKKLNRVRDGVPGNKETPEELQVKLKRELGDAVVYLDLMCQRSGFTLQEAGVEAFNSKCKEIGYTRLMPEEKP